jgi:site-specific recombinase XerD
MDDLPSRELENMEDAVIRLADGEHEEPLPALIADSGHSARFAWEEFIYGRLPNHQTRRVYRRAIERFFQWCHDRQLELVRIAPADVDRYLDGLTLAATTKKVHLAAIRHLFDELVTRHVVVLNPSLSVRTERVEVIEGKTPEITVKQVRKLFAMIDTSHVVGLRDRAIVGVLVYTAARVGAVARLRRGDFYNAGDQHCLRFNERREWTVTPASSFRRVA